MGIYRLLCLLAINMFSMCLHAQSSSVVWAYINKYKAMALESEKLYGVPASITLAQGIVESAAGTSKLTKMSNNHFGIKAFGWTGPFVLAQDDAKGPSKFRKYNSVQESFNDHARLLAHNNNYSSLRSLSLYDYRGWAYGLKRCGYATATHYAQALIAKIENYKLYEINGGTRLPSGKKEVVTHYEEREKIVPVYEEITVTIEEEISEEQEMERQILDKYVSDINSCHCTIIGLGESLAYVCRKYGFTMEELLALNEAESCKQFDEGDIVYLEKKKKKYNGPHDYYEARGGESLHDVSQMFGVQVSRLAKLNDTNIYARLETGDRILLK